MMIINYKFRRIRVVSVGVEFPWYYNNIENH